MKCEMCDRNTGNLQKIKNRHNGNELNICQSCAVHFGFSVQPPGTHWECKYCDYPNRVPYPGEPGFLVCGRCGAEWADCRVLMMITKIM